MQTLVAVVDGVECERTRRTDRPYTHAAVYRLTGLVGLGGCELVGRWYVLGFSLSEQNARNMAHNSARNDREPVEYRVVPLLRRVKGALLPLEGGEAR